MLQEEKNAVTVVNERDSVIIQINNGDESCGNIRMMKQDIDAIMELHGVERGYALEMMLQAVESTPIEEIKQEK